MLMALMTKDDGNPAKGVGETWVEEEENAPAQNPWRQSNGDNDDFNEGNDDCNDDCNDSDNNMHWNGNQSEE